MYLVLAASCSANLGFSNNLNVLFKFFLIVSLLRCYLCCVHPPSLAGGPIVVGRVAYCSQVPWIMPASLRDNITFQQPMQPSRYNAVIDACALNQDLAELPAGDLTELGERGINLSGGLRGG